MTAGEPVLEVESLRVVYGRRDGAVTAVDGVTFTLEAGERLAIVGESGSGKSTLALALLRLNPPPGRITGGAIRLGGEDILALDDEAMRRARLARIALIPQGAMNSLNPVLRIGPQIADALLDHDEAAPATVEARVAELLRSVGLAPDIARRFPHELSGGMKQRVAIAIAISNRPRVIVADEPTSALDVVVQRQVIDTLMAVQRGLRAAILLVGHDIGLVAQVADRVGVMYAGRLVELGPVATMLASPSHPYSRALIASIPTLSRRLERLVGIPGTQPALASLPPGCAFRPRCPAATPRCAEERPDLLARAARHVVACHNAEKP